MNLFSVAALILSFLIPIIYIALAFSIDHRLTKHINKDTLKQWHEDPNNWKKGNIYYNPADPRMLPPKKIKAMGWTINTANKRSIVGFLLAIGFTLITTAVIIIVEVI